MLPVCPECMQTAILNGKGDHHPRNLVTRHCDLTETDHAQKYKNTLNETYTCRGCKGRWWVVQDFDTGNKGTYLHPVENNLWLTFITESVRFAVFNEGSSWDWVCSDPKRLKERVEYFMKSLKDKLQVLQSCIQVDTDKETS